MRRTGYTPTTLKLSKTNSTPQAVNPTPISSPGQSTFLLVIALQLHLPVLFRLSVFLKQSGESWESSDDESCQLTSPEVYKQAVVNANRSGIWDDELHPLSVSISLAYAMFERSVLKNKDNGIEALMELVSTPEGNQTLLEKDDKYYPQILKIRTQLEPPPAKRYKRF